MPMVKAKVRCPHCGANEEVTYNVIALDQTITWNCPDPSCGAKTEFRAKDIAAAAEVLKSEEKTASNLTARVPKVEP